jgi:hypothetical protein
MLIAKNPRRLRARKRLRCKPSVLARIDAVIQRRILLAPAARQDQLAA